MLNFRYVLHLHDGDSERIVRHASFRPLQQGEIISLPGRGDWRVGQIVASSDQTFSDGIAYCEPAEDDEAAASG